MKNLLEMSFKIEWNNVNESIDKVIIKSVNKYVI